MKTFSEYLIEEYSDEVILNEKIDLTFLTYGRQAMHHYNFLKEFTKNGFSQKAIKHLGKKSKHDLLRTKGDIDSLRLDAVPNTEHAKKWGQKVDHGISSERIVGNSPIIEPYHPDDPIHNQNRSIKLRVAKYNDETNDKLARVSPGNVYKLLLKNKFGVFSPNRSTLLHFSNQQQKLSNSYRQHADNNDGVWMRDSYHAPARFVHNDDFYKMFDENGKSENEIKNLRADKAIRKEDDADIRKALIDKANHHLENSAAHYYHAYNMSSKNFKDAFELPSPEEKYGHHLLNRLHVNNNGRNLIW